MQEKTHAVTLTVTHSRGARGLLDWTLDDLARESGVAKDTILRWENRRNSPRKATLEAIRQAYERHGIVFTNGNNPGVILRREP